jgi:hypothetical protein
MSRANLMASTSNTDRWLRSAVDELTLSDRLIALAEAADRAGYTDTAGSLVTLACSVFDEASKRPT